MIQHQADAAVYGFAGSAPSMMRRLFEDPSQPLLEHAMPTELGPLPLDAVGDHIEERFEASGRGPGAALTPLLEFTRTSAADDAARPPPLAPHPTGRDGRREHLA